MQQKVIARNVRVSHLDACGDKILFVADGVFSVFQEDKGTVFEHRLPFRLISMEVHRAAEKVILQMHSSFEVIDLVSLRASVRTDSVDDDFSIVIGHSNDDFYEIDTVDGTVRYRDVLYPDAEFAHLTSDFFACAFAESLLRVDVKTGDSVEIPGDFKNCTIATNDEAMFITYYHETKHVRIWDVNLGELACEFADVPDLSSVEHVYADESFFVCSTSSCIFVVNFKTRTCRTIPQRGVVRVSVSGGYLRCVVFEGGFLVLKKMTTEGISNRRPVKIADGSKDVTVVLRPESVVIYDNFWRTLTVVYDDEDDAL